MFVPDSMRFVLRETVRGNPANRAVSFLRTTPVSCQELRGLPDDRSKQRLRKMPTADGDRRAPNRDGLLLQSWAGTTWTAGSACCFGEELTQSLRT